MNLSLLNSISRAEPEVKSAVWDYQTAFSRHDGLITPKEQSILKNSRVAIVGMGGVGGIHLMTLARLGIGSFSIADPDQFELANFNRQYGARTDTLGRSKVEVMAEELSRINPEAELSVFEAVTEENASEFLSGADLFLDGIDFFAIEMRRKLFQLAQEKGIYGITAAPLGFGTGWLIFDPKGMSFDEYFDFRDDQSYEDQLIALAVGVGPSLLHKPYIDTRRVDFRSGRTPSVGLGCQLAAAVTATECLKLLLSRGIVQCAPWYHQFDAYRGRLRHGRLLHGNRGLLQRLKRIWLRKLLRKSVTS